MPNYDLKRPCLNCPFRTDDTAIRFASGDRALAIWASGYFHGFPCHKAAEYVEADGDDNSRSGYYLGAESQHCAGFIIMQLQVLKGLPWPGIGDSQEVADWLAARVDMSAPVFDDVNEYLRASSGRKDRGRRVHVGSRRASPPAP